MAELAFDVEYDGPVLQAHEMDVRDLAPALLSTAELFQELNRELHPADPPVSVNVRATAEGSFLVQLKLVFDETVNVLTSPEMTATATLGALLTMASVLVKLIVRMGKSKEVERFSVEDSPGLVRLVFADGTSLEVPVEVLRLASNILIRRALAEVVRPLSRQGIDTLRLRRDNETIAEVGRQDVESFDPGVAPSGREMLADREQDTYLTILTASFQTGNKWRFSDGNTAFFAALEDEGFVERVDRGEAFSKLDVLHCRVRNIQWRDRTGLHSEVEVLEVLEHLPHEPGVQGEFFSEG